MNSNSRHRSRGIYESKGVIVDADGRVLASAPPRPHEHHRAGARSRAEIAAEQDGGGRLRLALSKVLAAEGTLHVFGG